MMLALRYKKTPTCVIYILFSCNLKSVKIYGKKIGEPQTGGKVYISALFLKENWIGRKKNYTQKLAMMLQYQW